MFICKCFRKRKISKTWGDIETFEKPEQIDLYNKYPDLKN
tara:strand:- start:358 stop:477 length:120 start_codon:yes stop_codon:yes gene_type:complete